MAKRVQVKHNIKGIRKLMRSTPVAAEVERVAKRMTADAGEGFEYEMNPYKYTARAFVQTDTDSTVGRIRQAQEHVLQRVVGRGAS